MNDALWWRRTSVFGEWHCPACGRDFPASSPAETRLEAALRHTTIHKSCFSALLHRLTGGRWYRGRGVNRDWWFRAVENEGVTQSEAAR